MHKMPPRDKGQGFILSTELYYLFSCEARGKPREATSTDEHPADKTTSPTLSPTCQILRLNAPKYTLGSPLKLRAPGRGRGF